MNESDESYARLHCLFQACFSDAVRNHVYAYSK